MLSMAGFEPGSSGIGSDRSVNCVTTTAQVTPFYNIVQKRHFV